MLTKGTNSMAIKRILNTHRTGYRLGLWPAGHGQKQGQGACRGTPHDLERTMIIDEHHYDHRHDEAALH